MILIVEIPMILITEIPKSNTRIQICGESLSLKIYGTYRCTF